LGYDGRGNAYNKKGDLDRAIADYTQAIQLDPKNGFLRRSSRSTTTIPAAAAACRPFVESS
jgi:hypothetical protein